MYLDTNIGPRRLGFFGALWFGLRNSFLGFILGMLALIMAVVVCVGGLVIVLDQAKCRQIAEQTQQDTRWTLTAGCFVHDGNRWVPYDRWINVHPLPTE